MVVVNFLSSWALRGIKTIMNSSTSGRRTVMTSGSWNEMTECWTNLLSHANGPLRLVKYSKSWGIEATLWAKRAGYIRYPGLHVVCREILIKVNGKKSFPY